MVWSLSFVAKMIFVLYWAGFLFVAWKKRRDIHAYDDFVVAGRKQSFHLVWFSLLATAVGASALLGISAQSEKIGWPIFWWLAVGAVGLAFQAWLLTERVRQFGVTTLPELVSRVIGKPAAWFVALVVAISWIGIVAAQFKAMGSVVAIFWPGVDVKLFIVISSLIMIVYTMVGGQFSVIATDRWQFFLLLLAVVLPLVVGIGDSRAYQTPFMLLNEKFGWKDLLMYLVLTGGAYLVGPDMFSRAMCARDGKTARKAVFFAALGLLPLALGITWAGIMASQISPGSGVGLLRLVGTKMGELGQVLVAIGILSALVSSADTTLLSSSTIWNQDVFGKRSVGGIKIALGGIGVLAILLALTDTPLLQMLLNVYSLYVPAVVFPTLVALLAWGKKKQPSRTWLLVAMAIGALFGVVSLTGLGGIVKPDRMIAVLGASVSFALSLIGWGVGKE